MEHDAAARLKQVGNIVMPQVARFALQLLGHSQVETP